MSPPIRRSARLHSRPDGPILFGMTVGGSRSVGFAVVVLSYLAAGLAGWAVVAVVRGQHPLALTLYADLVATAVVFAVSLAVGNASLYDPYWSVAPAVIVVAWVLYG